MSEEQEKITFEIPVFLQEQVKRLNKRNFVCYYYMNGVSNLSFGLSFDFYQPNLEIHLPFGFLRIGWSTMKRLNSPQKTFGYDGVDFHETGKWKFGEKL